MLTNEPYCKVLPLYFTTFEEACIPHNGVKVAPLVDKSCTSYSTLATKQLTKY